MKLEGKVDFKKKFSLFGLTSVGIAILLLILLVNNFIEIIPLQKKIIQGTAVLLPIFISPVGGLFGYIGLTLTEYNDRISYIGLVSNIALAAFTPLYMFFGTFIFGV